MILIIVLLILGPALISMAVVDLALSHTMEAHEVWFTLFCGIFITICSILSFIRKP